MAYLDEVNADSPHCHFRLNESSGNPSDEQANETLTVSGSPDYSQSGLINEGTCFKFASAGSKMNAGSPIIDGQANFTVELWFKTSDPTSYQEFFGCLNSGPTKGLIIYCGEAGNATIRAKYLNTAVPLTVLNGPTAVSGETYHVVFKQEGTTISLYVNGNLEDSFTDGDMSALTGMNNAIVADQHSATGFFIDEFATYNTALSESRIGVHYNAGIPASYSSAVLVDNPIAYWRVNESTGTNAADEQGNHDATCSTTPTWSETSLLQQGGGTAVTFPSGVYAQVSYAAALAYSNVQTWEWWAKVPSSGYNVSFAQSESATPDLGYALAVTPTAVSMTTYGTGGTEKTIAHNKSAGESIYVVVVKTADATVFDVYVDGSLIGQLDFSSAPSGSATDLYINHIPHLGGSWTGTLDELAIYDTKLTSTRIGAHWSEGSPIINASHSDDVGFDDAHTATLTRDAQHSDEAGFADLHTAIVIDASLGSTFDVVGFDDVHEASLTLVPTHEDQAGFDDAHTALVRVVPLDTPDGFTAVRSSDYLSCTLSCNAVAGADAYQWIRYEMQGGHVDPDTETLQQTASPSYVWSGLDTDASYVFRVRAYLTTKPKSSARTAPYFTPGRQQDLLNT